MRGGVFRWRVQKQLYGKNEEFEEYQEPANLEHREQRGEVKEA